MDNSIVRIYSEYIFATEKLNNERNFADGFMGFGKKEDNNSCHDKFYTHLEEELSALTKTSLSQTELVEILKYIYIIPFENRKNVSAYWMMIAAHSLTECLIPLLSKENAERFAEWYGKIYPRNKRLPVQNKILKLLKER